MIRRKLTASLMMLALMLSFASVVKASDFKSGDLYYTIVSENNALVRVDKAPSNARYSGDIVIPETVTYDNKTYTVRSMEDGVFNLSDISSLNIEAPITILPYFACHACHELVSLKLPSTLEKIEQYALSGCNNLTEINLPDGLTDIEYNTFSDCKTLKAIKIPESVINISSVALFKGCTSLTEVIFENEDLSGTNAYHTFQNCISLKNIVLTRNTTTIREECYSGCTGLEKVVFPEWITTIESEAFKDCTNLTALTFGSSFQSLGSQAFSNCYNISSVTCKNRNPKPFDGTSFTNEVYNFATLTVPSGCLEAYRNCDGWKNFKNIVEEEAPYPQEISIAQGQLELYVGSPVRIEAMITPAYSSHYRVEWSAPEELALDEISLADGVAACTVTPSKAGEYELTVKCLNDNTGEIISQSTCSITVKDLVAPTALNVEISDPVVLVNQTTYMFLSVNPNDFTGNYDIILHGGDSHLEIERIYVDIHGHSSLRLRSDKAGFYAFRVALHNKDTDKDELEQWIGFEVVDVGVSFNSVEGIIRMTYGGSEGLKVAINANDGYKVHSIVLNGNDVTDQYDADEMVTVEFDPETRIPAFDIVYEQTGASDITVVENEMLKIVQYGNQIEILGARDENSPVVLYDDMGRVVQQTNSHTLTIETRGVYILMVEGRRFKFMI